MRRPSTRNVRGVASDEVQNQDAIADAIGDVPNSYYTEGRLVTVEFTVGPGLDQTIPHKLAGACKADVVDILAISSVPHVVTYAVVAPHTADKFIRLVADGPCTATVWLWRR